MPLALRWSKGIVSLPLRTKGANRCWLRQHAEPPIADATIDISDILICLNRHTVEGSGSLASARYPRDVSDYASVIGNLLHARVS